MIRFPYLLSILPFIFLMYIAESASAERIYMNRHRGFKQFDIAPGSIFELDNTSDSLKSVNGSFDINNQNFSISWNLVSINNAEGISYKFTKTDSGRNGKASHPAWLLQLTDSASNGYALRFATVNTDPTGYEPIYTMQISLIELYKGKQGQTIMQTNAKNADKFTGDNIFRLERNHDNLSLSVANNPTLTWKDNHLSVNKMSFTAEPAARICINNIVLDIFRPDHSDSNLISVDSIKTRLNSSDDPIEGVWSYLDREMDESLLRLGGDYDLALINNGNGYDIIYLTGATTCASRWSTGKLKGRLIPSKFKGIYNVEWYDAEHKLMSRHITASFEGTTFFTISFPYQNSSIRFMRLSGKHATGIINNISSDNK